jgi:hypothetical protein
MSEGGREGELEEGELRATSDRLVGLVREVDRLEVLKRHAEIGTEDFVDLADDVARISRRLARWAEQERALARETAEARARGDLVRTSIEAVESRPAHRILAEWREAIVRADLAPPGTVEHAEAAADVERLRLEYQRLAAAKDGD